MGLGELLVHWRQGVVGRAIACNSLYFDPLLLLSAVVGPQSRGWAWRVVGLGEAEAGRGSLNAMHGHVTRPRKQARPNRSIYSV